MATGIFNALSVVRTGATIATGAASVNAVIPQASSLNQPYYIRVSATAAAYVKVGPVAQTAVPGDLLVQPGEPVILCIGPGILNIAAIQVTAPGIVQFSPLENQ